MPHKTDEVSLGLHALGQDLAAQQAQEEAIVWMVELRSGESSSETRLAFEQWLNAHPLHCIAWEKLTGAVTQALGELPQSALPEHGQRAELLDTALRKADKQAVGRRRLLRSALALGGLGAGLGWLVPRVGLHLGVMPDVYADISTGIGQRQSLVLPDGSRLLLDARSSADVDFSSGRRLIRLRHGRLMVSVQPGHAAPFIVQTAQGQARALGTRYTVRQMPEETLVEVLEHRVAVSNLRGDEVFLQQGERVQFGAERLLHTQVISAERISAWTQGWFIADDQALGELIDALRPYYKGSIQVSPQAARLRLTGRYSLEGVPSTLAVLADTLPVQLRRYAAGWLIQIDTKI